LGELFETPAHTVIDADGKQNGKGETRHEAVEAENQGVSQYVHEIGRGKKTLEVVKTNPGTAPYSKPGLETLKGHKNTVNGYVVEYHHVYKGYKE
jgi:hypothetical protein